MAIFKCQDIGVNDHFEVHNDDQEELMDIIQLHVQKTHRIKEISPEMMGKIKKAIIDDENCGTVCQDYA